jgi:hypothetical protein
LHQPEEERQEAVSTYEVNTEPYNETGGRWLKEPPTEPGFYWVKEREMGVSVAWRMSEGWFVFAYECDQHPTSEQLIQDGCIFWSERIKEPTT